MNSENEDLELPEFLKQEAVETPSVVLRLTSTALTVMGLINLLSEYDGSTPVLFQTVGDEESSRGRFEALDYMLMSDEGEFIEPEDLPEDEEEGPDGLPVVLISVAQE